MEKTKDQIHDESVDRIVKKVIRQIGVEAVQEKKMGRPPKDESEKRENNKVSVYLNQEELANIREMAENAGTSISNFIRTKLFL